MGRKVKGITELLENKEPSSDGLSDYQHPQLDNADDDSRDKG